MSSVDTTLALISLDDVKEYLRIDRDTEDSILGDLINTVSELANAYTGRFLLQKTYTEFYDGDGSMELFIINYPIVTVTSIWDDIQIPPAYGSGTLIDPTDYRVEKAAGIIRRFLLPFFCGRGNVKITYSAGYALASVPSDLKLAVKKWIATEYLTKYKDMTRLGVKQISQGDRTTTYSEEAVSKDIQNILNRYKRAGAGFASRGTE